MRATLKLVSCFGGVVLCGVGAVRAAASADELVGFRESAEIAVGKGATVKRVKTLSASPDAKVFKTGEGTLEMPLAALDSAVPYRVNVDAGDVRLAGDAGSLDATPPDCLNDALLWLDCTHANTVVTNGVDESGDPTSTEYVPFWYDRRETDLGNPTRPYAKASWTNHPNSALWGVPPCRQTVNGRSAIWFGGRLSSQCMPFMKKGVMTPLSNMCDIFIVHAVSNSLGILIGNKGDSSAPYYNTTTYDYDSAPAHYNFLRSNIGTGCFYSRAYLDGVRIDPYTVKPKRGFQCFNKHYFVKNSGTVAQGFSIFHGYPSGANGDGGDWISEIIVFDRLITDLERDQVERYLMRKWNLPHHDAEKRALADQKGVMLNTGSGASVSIDVAEGQSVSCVQVAGDGALVKSGEGSLWIGPSDTRRPFTGPTELTAGSFFLQGGKPPSLPVSAGTRILSGEIQTKTGPNRKARDIQASSGTRITVDSSANADEVLKDGEGPARIRSIAAGVRRLKVAKGRLALDVGYADATTNVAPVSVTIPNADFEISGSPRNDDTAYENFSYFISTSGFGWTCDKVGDVMILTENWTDATAGVSLTHRSTWLSPPIAQGTNALYLISGPYSASTTVTFPRAGRYAFSFLGCARNQSSFGTPVVSLKLGDTVFGTCKVYHDKWTRYYYRTFSVAANQPYALTITTRNKQDTGAALDDLRFDYLDESDRTPTAYAIPNGDFENVIETNDSDHQADHVGRFETQTLYPSNQTEGWTLTTDLIAAERAFAFLSHISKYDYSTCQDDVWGAVQLGLVSRGGTNGWATTTFTPPAGTYRVRARLASYPVNHGIQLENAPEVVASVTIGGQQSSLGKLSIGKLHVLTDKVWPTAFTVDGSQAVTLTLSNTSNKSCVLVDDVDLVSAAEYGVKDGELLTAGDFESSTPWKIMDPLPPQYSTARMNNIRNYEGTVSGSGTPFADIWGSNRGSGDYNLIIGTCGGMQQTVTLPAAGVYRLSFLERSRLDTDFGGNRISVWCRSEDRTETNFIIRTTQYFATNFVENTAYFRVNRGGTYVLGIEGLGTNPAKSDEDVESVYDDFSLRKVTKPLAEVPDVPSNLRITVEKGALLQLDFPGTLRTGTVKLGGTPYKGTISAKTHPEYICGMGTIEAVGDGCVIIIR